MYILIQSVKSKVNNMGTNRLIGEMKNGQQMFQCIVCKTVWSQYTNSVIPVQCPECKLKQKIEYKEELIDDMFKKSLPVQIPIQCPECKPKIDRVGEKQKRIQGIVSRINKEKLKSSVPFMRKLSHLDEVDWNQVSVEKVTKIYKILMELE